MKKIITSAAIFAAITVPLYASYEDALRLFQQGKYSESVKMIADELEVGRDFEPGSPNYSLRYLAAHNHWKLGTAKSPAAHFKRCMEIKKDEVEPYIDLSLYYIDIKKYNDAESTARKGLEIEESAMLYYALGKAALQNRNYWRAKEYFEKANSLDNEIFISYNGLGMALMNLGRYPEANVAFSVASALNPESAELLNNLALSCEQMKKYGDALKYLQKAAGKNPENRVIAENLERAGKQLEKK